MNRRPGLGARLAAAWRGLRLRDAVIFTLPVVASVVWLLVAAVLDYRQTRQFEDWWSSGASVPGMFRARLEALVRAPRASTLRLQLDPEAADPGILRLIVDPASWASLHGDPLEGWSAWADATLIRGSERTQVGIRKRGDTSVHFTTERTSFTLRMPRSSLFAGSREIGVTGKTVLTSWLANRLPAEFDVLTPRTEIAPVFVNDRFYGVFRLAETIDESFLRNAGRMPGMVFRADAAERGEFLKGSERNVFRNPQAWERPAEGAVPPGFPPDSALLGLLAALNGDTFEDHLEMMARVDRSQLAGVIAAALVLGDPYHMSGVHNQNWYEDPTNGMLYLIPWDFRLLPLARPAGTINTFLERAFRDPFVIDAVLQRLSAQLEGDSIYHRAERLVTAAWNRYEPHFRQELLRRRAISDPGTPAEILSQLRANVDLLREWLDDSRVLFATGLTDDGTAILDFETAGWAGSLLEELHIPGAAPATLRLRADRDMDGRPGPGDMVIPIRLIPADGSTRVQLLEPLPMLSSWRAAQRGFTPGRVRYRLFLVGGEPEAMRAVRPALRNPYTRQPAAALPWVEDADESTRGWSTWHFPEARPPVHRILSGAVALEQDLHIREGDVLELAPGTTLRLAPGVSVESRGRVVARGTSTAPIRVLPAVPGNPWGVFALQGSGADRSVFEHVTFAEGSSARVRRVGYKGMVDVHHADSVVFRNVRFERNLKSDDALNAVYANVHIIDSDFVNANSDAIDFDHSGGVIRNSRFRNGGGDAIDAMTSAPLIVGNVIEGSGDKGISVGEGSHPIIVDNLISGGSRGIEVKDASRPLIVHNLVTGNRVGLSQKVKNWRYGGGGWATVLYSVIEGNDLDMESDEASRLTVLESRIGVPGETAVADTAPPARMRLVGSRSQPSAAPPAIVPEWIHARLGLRGADRLPGRLVGSPAVVPAPPVFGLKFSEELAGDLFGWSVHEGTARLAVRGTELVAEFEGRRGVIGRQVDWDMAEAGYRYQGVIELGGQGIGDVTIRFMDGQQVRAATTVSIPDAPGTRWLVTVDLPRGRVTDLRIESTPRADAQRVNPETGMLEVRTGRLRIGGVHVYGWRGAEPS